MKALVIKLEHERIWTAETSDGKRVQGATLDSTLDKLAPLEATDRDARSTVALIFDGITDSGSTGNIARGQASG